MPAPLIARKRSPHARWIVASLFGGVALLGFASGVFAIATWRLNFFQPQVAKNDNDAKAKPADVADGQSDPVQVAPAPTNTVAALSKVVQAAPPGAAVALAPEERAAVTPEIKHAAPAKEKTPALAAATKNESFQDFVPIKTQLGQNSRALAIDFSDNGATFAVAGDSVFNVWTRGAHSLGRVTDTYAPDDYQFRLSPNGAYAAVIARDSRNFNRFHGGVWSTTDGAEVYKYDWTDPPQGCIPCFAFSPKSTYFASLAPDNIIVVTDLLRRAEVAKLRGHRARIGALEFSPNETSLFSASSDAFDGTTRRWTFSLPQQGEFLVNGRAAPGTPTKAAPNPSQQSQILIKGKAVSAIAALPDGKTLSHPASAKRINGLSPTAAPRLRTTLTNQRPRFESRQTGKRSS